MKKDLPQSSRRKNEFTEKNNPLCSLSNSVNSAVKTFLFFSVLALSGCGGVEGYNRDCAKSYSAFRDQVLCVRYSVYRDKDLSRDKATRDAIMKGDALSYQVDAGKLTEEQAKKQFEQDLKNIREAEAEALAREARQKKTDDDFLRPKMGLPRGGNSL